MAYGLWTMDYRTDYGLWTMDYRRDLLLGGDTRGQFQDADVAEVDLGAFRFQAEVSFPDIGVADAD